MDITSVLCILVSLVFIGFVLGRGASRGNRKPAGSQEADSISSPPKRSNRWILPIIVTLVIAVWTVVGALFFLLIVWVLRLNPKEQLSNVVADIEKKICATNYRWLRNSSFITIPVFFVALFLGTPPAIAALIPFVFHISLIQRLKTNSLYVYRHTQQSLLLLLLRAASASIIFSIFYIDEGFWPFILVNGSLWLFGTNWEISQVTRNESWLMRRNGEAIIVSETQVAEKSPTEDEFEDLIKSLNVEGNTTRQKALRAFQSGTPEIRKKAVLILSKLGEVEKF